MSLRKHTPAPTTSTGKSFEDDDSDLDQGSNTSDTGGAEDTSQHTRALSADERVAAQIAKQTASAPAAKAEAKAETPAASAAATATTAVAVQKPNAGAVALNVAAHDPFVALENALTVDWNTLPRVMATNGNFQNKETQKLMGDEITVQVLSVQEHFVVSPGGEIDDEASRPFLKYSDDGKFTREGEDVNVCVQAAIDAGYLKAALKRRCILVVAVVNGGKAPEMNDTLAQIDLAPNSYKNFKQHRFTTAYQIGKGKKVADESATILKLTAIVKQDKKMTWTEAGFSNA